MTGQRRAPAREGVRARGRWLLQGRVPAYSLSHAPAHPSIASFGASRRQALLLSAGSPTGGLLLKDQSTSPGGWPGRKSCWWEAECGDTGRGVGHKHGGQRFTEKDRQQHRLGGERGGPLETPRQAWQGLGLVNICISHLSRRGLHEHRAQGWHTCRPTPQTLFPQLTPLLPAGLVELRYRGTFKSLRL